MEEYPELDYVEVECLWCSGPMTDDNINSPYCCSMCAIHAERDSEEDNDYETR